MMVKMKTVSLFEMQVNRMTKENKVARLLDL